MGDFAAGSPHAVVLRVAREHAHAGLRSGDCRPSVLLPCCPTLPSHAAVLVPFAVAARTCSRAAGSPPVRPHGAPDAHTLPCSGAGARVHRAGEADGGGQAEKVRSLALQPKCSVLLILIKG